MIALALLALSSTGQLDNQSMSVYLPDLKADTVQFIVSRQGEITLGGILSNDKGFMLIEREGTSQISSRANHPSVAGNEIRLACGRVLKTIDGINEENLSHVGLVFKRKRMNAYIQATKANSAETPYEDECFLDLIARFYISCIRQPELQNHSQQSWAGATINTAHSGNRNVFNATHLFNLRPTLPELTGKWGEKSIKVLPGYTKAKIDGVEVDCADVPILTQGEIWLDQSFLEHLGSN